MKNVRVPSSHRANHNFSMVPSADIPRSTFDRSHGHKTTFDAGYLVPIFVDEALPGDTFNLNMTGFARLATPIFPIMDNMTMDTQFFAVPVRLLWDNWEKFNGAQDNPGDSTDFLVPQIVAPAGGYQANSLEDYMGLPVGVAGLSHSALWHRALNQIWNQWYRDENLQDSLPVHKGDGPDPSTDYSLLKRGKRPDYFTSCLPWPQKGPGVQIPLGGSAPVVANGTPTFQTPGSAGTQLVSNTGSTNVLWGTGSEPTGLLSWVNPALIADLTAATAATINSLRQAFQIQKMYERDARGGTRYTEILRSHFKVESPDYRLQRPEYLGGGSSPINISPIPQTSASGTYAASPQGNLAAMGTALAKGHGFTQSFTEHCVIIGLMSVRADLTYQQGLNRMWSRRTRPDFYLPVLHAIGEQAVLQKEIFADGNPANDDKVFGYAERYAEYRYKPSIITGEFRSSFPQSLDSWHLAQDFATAPVLDAAFIEENPPVDRVIAVPAEPHFLLDCHFDLKCSRPMPVYGVPGYIDHF